MSSHTAAERTSAKRTDTKKLTVLAMFVAMGFICLFVCRFKFYHLTLDFKDVFITMAGFIYGPAAAFAVALTETVIELVTVASTGFWGAIMNIAGSASFACTASLIYKYNKSFKGAIIGLCTAVFVMTAVMMPMNILITPLYANVSMQDVIALIPTMLLPFNFLKGLLNASVTYILYKPLTQALRGMNVLPKKDSDFEVSKKTAIGFIVAAVMIVVSVVVLLNIFNSQFQVIKPAK